MKMFAHFVIYVFIASVIMACSVAGRTENLIKPGDKIGEMTVEQGSTSETFPPIWLFCENYFLYGNKMNEPISITNECDVPLYTSNLDIVFGWLASEEQSASNWDAITWEMYIDGCQIDLEAFEWAEFTDRGYSSRQMIITLKNVTPGMHTLRLSWTSDIAVDNAIRIYKPGTYEQVTNFTVSE